jgi:hypothetical protein
MGKLNSKKVKRLSLLAGGLFIFGWIWVGFTFGGALWTIIMCKVGEEIWPEPEKI